MCEVVIWKNHKIITMNCQGWEITGRRPKLLKKEEETSDIVAVTGEEYILLNFTGCTDEQTKVGKDFWLFIISWLNNQDCQ